MNFTKRVGAAVTASALALGLFAAPLDGVPLLPGAAVSAAEKTNAVSDITLPTVTFTADSLPDNAELEEMYLDKLFYGNDGIALLADFGKDSLTGTALSVYTQLRTGIEKIANGDVTSTKIEITINYDTFSDDFSAALNCLLVDLPASFYWYDKTALLSFSFSGSTATVPFPVSQDYKGNADFTVDTAEISAAKTAVAKAQSIANKYTGKSDYEKIRGYCKEICALTSYNDEANQKKTPQNYGGINPWQLVWVFDDDASTEVVCEGYSKAFQYLCDLGGIECYTVTGNTSSGNGAGAHMWNVVVLDGKSYLVDITNCDGEEGASTVSIGYPDLLLLKGANQSTGNDCSFTGLVGGSSLQYTYDPETLSLYGSAGILEVSTEDYTPGAAKPVLALSKETETVEKGKTVTITGTSESIASGDKLSVTSSTPAAATAEIKNFNAVTGAFDVVVTGVDVGETEITVTYTDDEKVNASCTVTVTKAPCETHTWGEWTSSADGHSHKCSVCNAEETEDHTGELKSDTAVDATCIKEGKKADTVCSVCDYVIKDGEVIPALGHDMKEVANSAKEPTCLEDGKEADKECSRCDERETGAVIKTKGHTPGTPVQENIKDATCTVAGSYDKVTYCTVCKEKIKTEHVDGEKLDHELEEVPGSAKDPTCAEEGKKADKKCKNCNYTEPGEVIPATKNHTPGEPVREVVKSATCTEEGSYNEVIKCSVCGKILETTTGVIEKLDHTPGEAAKEKEVAATCTKDGSYDMVVRCTVCETEISSEQTVVPAAGHDFTMKSSSSTHWQECTKCGEKFGEEAHNKNNCAVTPATADTEGSRVYSCSVCGTEVRTETIPKIEEGHKHNYTVQNSDSTSHWNECECGDKDLDSVTAHNEGEPSETVQTAPTCKSDGVKIVTVECSDCHRVISTTAVMITERPGHTPGAEYGKDSEKHWQTCTVCDARINEENHIAGPAATEETPQTCTVCGYEMAPVLAHTHTFSDAWSKDGSFHWHDASCGHTGEVSAKAPHDWDEGVITVQPTETAKGEKTYTCTVCGAAKTEPVSELSHTHTPGSVWRFNSEGHWHDCGGCDEKLDFAAHNQTSEVTKAPTATLTGTRRYLCSVCGYVIKEETIPATGVISPDNNPSYPSGSTIVFPPSANVKEPILENGSGKSGWESVADDIAAASNGSAVHVDMNGTTTLSRKALAELAGKNVDLVLEMNNQITWTINGETVEKIRDINMRARLNTRNIPESVTEEYAAGNSIVQLTLSHSGSFGFDAVMTINLGTRYDGKFANLLYYNSKTKELEYVDCSIISGGMASLDFSHASDYAIVISDEPMGDYEDVSAAAGISETGSMISLNGGAFPIIAVICAVSAAVVIFRKRTSK
ncbi:MAG: hypothetical protein NC395_05615 [Prevotella sp.]|nr:hypothetical protein [Prevotella sp.]